MRVEEVVGVRVRDARESRDMTQEELGEKLGELLGRPWSRQAVSAAEKGGRAFTGAELVALAVALGTTVPRLFTPPSKVSSVEMPNGIQIDRAQLVGVAGPEFSDERALRTVSSVLPALTELAERMHATSLSAAHNVRDIWRIFEELELAESERREAAAWANLRENQAAAIRRQTEGNGE